MRRTPWNERFAEAAASKMERTKKLLAQMKERQSRECTSEPPPLGPEFQLVEDDNVDPLKDRDFEVLTSNPARNLIDFADLLDRVVASDDKVHVALFWPH